METGNGNSPPMMTIKQVAEHLQCSSANVYSLINNGELPVVSVGARKGYRIDPQDLENFISRRKMQKEGERVNRPRPRLKHIKL
jgi:excisionase family DNA binding protein